MSVHTNKKTNIEINPLKPNNSNLATVIKEENENKKRKLKVLLNGNGIMN